MFYKNTSLNVYLNYVSNSKKGLLNHLPNTFSALFSNKYCINERNFPKSLEIIARTADMISVIRHKRYRIYGCQFHPERCRNGLEILNSFIDEN